MAEIEIRNLVLGMVSTNVWLVKNEETGGLVIIDPADQPDRIDAMIRTMEGKPEAILLTHGHFDHIGAANALREKYRIPIYAGEKEAEMLEDPSLNMSENVSVKMDHPVREGQVLELAGLSFTAFHTPGHTEGGMCYYLEEHQILFSGDTLFFGSYGRTDFVGGSSRKMMDSVRRLLRELPPEVQVLPGHMSTTSIGQERRINPLA
ncbi:MAG: MBL fold metallo-hydrolase [Eubacteriales bacterium]|nr:MBL fold metallo-hydrolase [Eubacteriales bacterium]